MALNEHPRGFGSDSPIGSGRARGSLQCDTKFSTQKKTHGFEYKMINSGVTSKKLLVYKQMNFV